MITEPSFIDRYLVVWIEDVNGVQKWRCLPTIADNGYRAMTNIRIVNNRFCKTSNYHAVRIGYECDDYKVLAADYITQLLERR